MKTIDDFLDNITMYRLVLYYLLILFGWAALLSGLGILAFNIFSLIFSTIFIVGVCWATNKIFAKVFNVPTNFESIYISAFILSLIITPISNLHAIPFVFWASVWTTASKYIFALHKKHLFNPVAMGLIVTGLGITGSASWWVGTAWMLPVVVAGGLLIVKKVRRWDLVVSFLIIASGTILMLSLFRGNQLVPLLGKIFFDSPILFFAFVMLTEPLTTPPDKMHRIVYGALMGFLFAPQLHFGTVYTTPEMALVLGNIYSYLVSPKEKLILKLKEKIQLAPNIYDFVFALEKKLSYFPGQYMEWTLEFANPDRRGNRRYFSLASSPTEDNLRLGIRFNNPSSSYKNALLSLKPGEEISTSSLGGEFVLPEDKNQKLVFVAGGIGVIPFRSMIKHMIDKTESRNVVLFYSVKNPADAVYLDLFKEAENLGLKIIITITDTQNIPGDWQGEVGSITQKMITRKVPDYEDRLFYLSGPHRMVTAFEKTLSEMGLKKSHIKTDYFTGYA